MTSETSKQQVAEASMAFSRRNPQRVVAVFTDEAASLAPVENMTAVALNPARHNTPYYSEMESPLGTLLLLGDGSVLTGLYMNEQKYRPLLPNACIRDDRRFRAVREQLHAYFSGELRQFDVQIAGRGTPFQQAVWNALCEIPYGSTETYGNLAKRLGNERASRAVGLANGRNPLGIIVPCHRVIGADGSLTGYGGGVERKRWLLEHEQRHVR